jgi:vancomycin resistance protein YoaR
VACALGAVALAPDPEAKAARPVVVRIAQSRLDSGTESARSRAEALAAEWLRTPITLTAGDRQITRSRAALGAEVDVERLAKMIEEARDPLSLLRRFHDERNGDADLVVRAPMTLRSGRVLESLRELADVLLSSPEEPKLDRTTSTVRPERIGRSLDIYASLDAIEAAFESLAPSVALTLVDRQPTRTSARFAEASFGAVLGEFETRYSGGENAQDRIANLRAAAARVDGVLLEPGEEFDFNAIVGERSQANGFRDAPVIANGLLSEDVGGGTCQISGTLHAAAFFAGLPIVERHPHSRPSYYIKMGLDAMVSYPTRNLRFRNDLPFPIGLLVGVESGLVRVEVRGATRHREVTFVRRIDQTLPFEETDLRDSELPMGLRVLRQRGIPGFKLSRFRVVRDVSTNQSRRERMEDMYPPTSQVWRIGASSVTPPGFEPPADDDHLEYVADEVLLATEGPGIQGMSESRRPGRTGEYGWTERAGMLRRGPR